MIYTDNNHLTADSVDELVSFIVSMGFDHTDMNLVRKHIYLEITADQAETAKENGAKLVSTPEMVELSEKIKL